MNDHWLPCPDCVFGFVDAPRDAPAWVAGQVLCPRCYGEGYLPDIERRELEKRAMQALFARE